MNVTIKFLLVISDFNRELNFKPQLRAIANINIIRDKSTQMYRKQILTHKRIDVLNDHGLRTGEVLPREEIQLLGKIHRAVHLYLFDLQGNILLQQRSEKVDHYPGMLSISLTAHVDTGESSSLSLHREIKEELHLDPDKMKCHFLFSYRNDAILSPAYIDRQLNDVYLCFHDFELHDICFHPEETTGVCLMPFSQFRTMVEDQHTLFGRTYGTAYTDLIFFLKNYTESKNILRN